MYNSLSAVTFTLKDFKNRHVKHKNVTQQNSTDHQVCRIYLLISINVYICMYIYLAFIPYLPANANIRNELII